MTKLRQTFPRSFASLLFFAALSFQAAAKETGPSPNTRKEYTPNQLREGAVSLDGILDDPVWQNTPARDDFVERSPTPGGAPKFRTSFRVVYDAEALYVAVQCEQPTEPRIRSMRRDSGKLYSDDAVAVRIDPYLDRRTTFEFATNAAGAQVDLLILDKGNNSTFAYDALWEVASSATPEGWTAEFRIPFGALGAPKEGGFGLDIQRFVAGTNQMYQWSVVPQGVNHNDASFYGDLSSVRGIKAGQPLQFTPYLLTNSSAAGTETSEGFDLRASLGTVGSAQVSFRTDFAQVSPDNAFVNLGRFAVALPERRPFFLEGTEIFSFGSQNSNQLFFSRRIGIEDDISGASVVVPLDLGAKVQGRSGAFSFGAMNVLTAEAPGLDPGVTIPRSNYSVARVRRELSKTANTGLLLTYRQTLPNAEAPALRGLSLGWDGNAQFLKNTLTTSATAAYTRNDAIVEGLPGEAQEGFSATTNIDYSGEVFFMGVQASALSPEYNPAVGFVPRTNITRGNTFAGVTLRPKDLLGLASVTTGLDAGANTQTDDLSNLLDANGGAFLSFDWKSGYNLNAGASYGYEQINEEFSPLPNQLVPAGDYLGGGVGIGASTPSNKDIRLSLNGFFDQSQRTPDQVLSVPVQRNSLGASASLSADFGRYVTTNLSANNTLISTDLEGTKARGNVVTLNGSASFALNTSAIFDATLRLFDVVDLDALQQGSDLADASLFGNALGQLRFNWRFRPGSDLFLIYNARRDLTAFSETPERSFIVKVSLAFLVGGSKA
jgi:hypothetical protein